MGGSGEFYALADREKDRAIEIAVDEAGGRVPVIAGVTDLSTRRAIRNAHAALGSESSQPRPGLSQAPRHDRCGKPSAQTTRVKWPRQGTTTKACLLSLQTKVLQFGLRADKEN